MKLSSLCVFALFFVFANDVAAQTFDIHQLLRDKKLKLDLPQPFPFEDNGKKGIAFTGAAWLTGVDFSTGVIEVDLRGQDVMQRSFIGIAFHGVDSLVHDIVYFRPFNFRSADPVRKIHAVQYVSLPEYSWDRLRKEHEGVYEKAVTPAPEATAWFHAKIEVTKTEVIVYVDKSTTPSLTVKKLNDRQNGRIGLWNEGLPGQFANLVITKSK